MILFLILAGVNLIMKAKDADGPKKSISSILYIAYGAFLIFGVIWILGTVLNLPNIQ
jgi:TRAP-type C4-dicarboxylate transport system permease small subunit